MTTIILADPDKEASDAIAGRLNQLRPQWSVVACSSGQDALSYILDNTVDCVVSDVVLDDMSGHELFESLEKTHPDIVRFTLSADLDRERSLESSHTNHRFVHKPVSDDVLLNFIERSLLLRTVLDSELITHEMDEVHNLPSLPEIYQEMISELAAPQSSLLNVANIIDTDLALSATVLKVVNSAFYGLHQPVDSVAQSVSLLGAHLIKNITLTAKVFAQFEGTGSDLAMLKRLNNDAIKTGALSNQMARLARVPKNVANHAQMAGMLSNIGQLLTLSNASQLPQTKAELRGAYLLRTWLLPDAVVEAVALQHETATPAHTTLTPLVIVHAAHYLQENLIDTKDVRQLQNSK